MRSVPDPIRVEVAPLVRESVASMYSHLVTRPTGRAVRLAIEAMLAEAGEPTITLVDLSEITILDYSCADEVVARLLRRYTEVDRPREAFFVFQGVQARHREPIEAVLERQSLAAVSQRGDGSAELLGTLDEDETAVWRLIEMEGVVPDDRTHDIFGNGSLLSAVDRLVERRLVFSDASGGTHALSRLVATLEGR
ncbi:MAG TPA: hypothetical protein VJ925_10370 [Longimicrobiales bacterium]|nr:hypothetical protein [Longimicrobiales bacterium]